MPVIRHQCKSVHTNTPAPFISPPARCGDIAVCSSASMEEGWGRVNQAPYRESATLVTSCFSNLLFDGITLLKPFLLDSHYKDNNLRSVWEGLEAPTQALQTVEMSLSALGGSTWELNYSPAPYTWKMNPVTLANTWSNWHTCMGPEEGYNMYLYLQKSTLYKTYIRTKIYRMIPTDFKNIYT